MSRGKAKFSGNIQVVMDHDHDAVREAIVKAIPALAGDDYVDVVDEIVSAAWEAAWRIADSELESHLRDQQAELKKLEALIDKGDKTTLDAAISRLSPDVWWAFQGIGFDVSTAANRPGEFREHMTRLRAATLPLKRRRGEVLHDAGVALAHRVQTALAPHGTALGIALSSHARDYIHSSPLIQLLGRIGDSIGLTLEATTWRDYLSEIKNGEDAPTRV